MNNEQILENWNLQFKDQKKLNIEETKKLIELANMTDDEELKKEYFNQAILGTQHVIYNYLKNSKLYLLSVGFNIYAATFASYTIFFIVIPICFSKI